MIGCAINNIMVTLYSLNYIDDWLCMCAPDTRCSLIFLLGHTPARSGMGPILLVRVKVRVRVRVRV